MNADNGMPPAPSAPGSHRDRARIGINVALVYAVTCLATFGITRLRGSPGLDEYVHVGIALLFLIVPYRLAARIPNGPVALGIDLAGVAAPAPDDSRGGIVELGRVLWTALPSAGREIAFSLAVAAVVFPIYAAGFWAWHAPPQPFTPSLPSDLASFLGTQLVMVGLPEEAFFRGYVQSRLGLCGSRSWRVVGARVAPLAWLTQAAAFALIHFLVDLDPARLAVFFPGLLFGWVRARRGGIGAAIVVHALSNVFSDFLVRGWL